MNKFDQLAAQRFGGDAHRAAVHIASLPKEQIEIYAKEMKDRQLQILLEVINHKALSDMTEEQRVQELGRDYVRNKRRKLLFSREEFVSAPENPYETPMIRSFLLLAAALLVPLALLFLVPGLSDSVRQNMTIVCGVVLVCLASPTAEHVSNFFKFRRYRALYSRTDLDG